MVSRFPSAIILDGTGARLQSAAASLRLALIFNGPGRINVVIDS